MNQSQKLLRLPLRMVRGLAAAPPPRLPRALLADAKRTCGGVPPTWHTHLTHRIHHKHLHHLGAVCAARREVSHRCIAGRSVNKMAALRAALPTYATRLTHKQVLLQLKAMCLTQTQRAHFTSATPLLYIKAGGSQRSMSSKSKSCTYIMKPKDKKKKKDQSDEPMITVEECCDYCDKRVRKALDQLAAIVKCKARELAEGTEEQSHKPRKKSRSRTKCKKKSSKSRSCSSSKKKRSKSKKSKSRSRSKSKCKSRSKSKSKSKSRCKSSKKSKKHKKPKMSCKPKEAKSVPCVTEKKRCGPFHLQGSSSLSRKCKSDSAVGDKVKKPQVLEMKLKSCGKGKDKKKKKKGPKTVCKKRYAKHLCKKRPSKKKSSKDVCKKKSKKGKKSSKDLCKKKSSKDLKKKKSSKDLCKKKSSKGSIKKKERVVCKKKSIKSLKSNKSSKSVCKKKSSKGLKKKSSSKSVCKKKSSKDLKKKKSSKDVCKKKSSKSLKSAKSSKSVCKKKSSKDLKKKSSSKSVCKKKSSKDLKKKKSSKDLCKKKSSSKSVKSSKNICKTKSSKDLKKKKSSKVVCKKKSSKDVKKKKSSKSVCKKKSSKDLKKKSSSKSVCKKKSSKDLKKKKSSKSVCKKKSSKDLKKKSSSKSVCKKKSSKHLKKKKSLKDLCKTKSSKDLKKKKSSKSVCKKKSSKDLKKKSSSKSVCKKKSSKDLKKKSSDNICLKKSDLKKKSSKNVCLKTSVLKKKSSKGVCKKSSKDVKKAKSAKDVCKKKSSKDVKKTPSSKSVCTKKSSKDLKKKKSSKDLCKQKSSTDVKKKPVCKKKSSKDLKKAPSKDLCKKKSSKDTKKKDSKEVCKKKSSKDLKKKSSKDKCKKSSTSSAKAKPSKLDCKKKSSKDLKKKKSCDKPKKKKKSKNVICRTRTKEPKKKARKTCKTPQKKKKKDTCKKKSSKDLKEKKSSKDLKKKKSCDSMKPKKKEPKKKVCPTQSGKSLTPKPKPPGKTCKTPKKKSSKDIKEKKKPFGCEKKKKEPSCMTIKKKKSTCDKKKKKKKGEPKCNDSSQSISQNEYCTLPKSKSAMVMSTIRPSCNASLKPSKSTDTVKAVCAGQHKKIELAMSIAAKDPKASCNALLKKKPKKKSKNEVKTCAQGSKKNSCHVKTKKKLDAKKKVKKVKSSKSSKKSSKKMVCMDGCFPTTLECPGQDTIGKVLMSTGLRRMTSHDNLLQGNKYKAEEFVKVETRLISEKPDRLPNLVQNLLGDKEESNATSRKGKDVKPQQDLMSNRIKDDNSVDELLFKKSKRSKKSDEDLDKQDVMSNKIKDDNSVDEILLKMSKKTDEDLEKSHKSKQDLMSNKIKDDTSVDELLFKKSKKSEEEDFEEPFEDIATPEVEEKRKTLIQSIKEKSGKIFKLPKRKSKEKKESLDNIQQLEVGQEMILKSDGHCHKTMLNVPHNAEKIVLEIDLKNVNQGPIVTKITATPNTPNHKVEVEQEIDLTPTDLATQSIRQLNMSKEISVKQPPRAVSEVKLYTLQSPVRKHVMQHNMQRELVKYIQNIQGEKPNTLVFEAKKVRDKKNKVFETSARAMHTTVRGSMIDPPALQHLKDVKEPAIDAYSCKEPLMCNSSAVRDPGQVKIVTDPIAGLNDPVLCKGLKDKTFSDVFPPGNVQKGMQKDSVFQPGRCLPPKEKPNCGACTYYYPMAKPTFAACEGAHTLEDYINPKKKDTFYARLCGKPMAIDECSTKLEYVPTTTLTFHDSLKRAQMLRTSRMLSEQAKIRAACEAERRIEACNREAMEKVQYCTIDFEEMSHCNKSKRESRRQQQECFKALAAKWNRVNSLKNRRQRRRLQHPPTYTHLPKKGTCATFMDEEICYEVSPPGEELKPDYGYSLSANGEGQRVRREWRDSNATTQKLVAAQKNPNVKVYRDETTRQLCGDYARCGHKFRLVQRGAPEASTCDPKYICTCTETKKDKKDEKKKKGKGNKTRFIGASLLPLMWTCNEITVSRSSIVSKPSEEVALKYFPVERHTDIISRTAEWIMMPVNSIIHYLLPKVVPSLKIPDGVPEFNSAIRALKDDKPKDLENKGKGKVEVKSKEVKKAPRVPAPTATELPSRETIVHAIATYLAKLFPSADPKETKGGASTSANRVMPIDTREAEEVARRLRHILRHRQEKTDMLRLKDQRETESAIHKAKQQLKDSQQLLDEVMNNAKALEDKIKNLKNMESAKVRGTRAKLEAYYNEMVTAQHSLEKHIKSQQMRLARVLKGIGEAKGEIWQKLQELTKTEVKMEKIRKLGTDVVKKVTTAAEVKQVRTQWQETIKKMQLTIAELEKEDNIKKMSEHVKKVRHLIHKRIRDPHVEDNLRKLEMKNLEATRNMETHKIREKANELKDQLIKLKELANKPPSDNMGKNREETLKQLKAAAEEKEKEIKKLLDEVVRKEAEGKKGKK